MDKFVIQGGSPLSGSITPNGSKNEVLPCLAATLLSDEPIILHNVPQIRDVFVMLQILEHLGGTHEWISHSSVRVHNHNITTSELDYELCRRLRSSILFAGALIARMHSCTLPPPGGDVIGRRRLDSHVLALSALGTNVEIIDGIIHFTTPKLVGTEIFLDEASVTATENAIMAAAVAQGVTVIRNAACEPHVQGLCNMLNRMGAQIEGIGANTLTIKGTKSLWGAEHSVGPDYLEIGSFVGLAAVTKSELTIKGVQPNDLRMIRLVFEKLGVSTTLNGNDLFIPRHDTLTIRDDFQGQIPKVDDAPWPAFPTDMMSIAITVATQAVGSVLFFEKMFEGRMFFIDSLQSMGARIIFCDPHRVVVVGPSRLYGSTLESPDVRAGMSLLIAALAAEGTSTIFNVHHIDRGYENIVEKLSSIGAQIVRLPADSTP